MSVPLVGGTPLLSQVVSAVFATSLLQNVFESEHACVHRIVNYGIMQSELDPWIAKSLADSSSEFVLSGYRPRLTFNGCTRY